LNVEDSRWRFGSFAQALIRTASLVVLAAGFRSVIA
jgi:hypothetical protein